MASATPRGVAAHSAAMHDYPIRAAVSSKVIPGLECPAPAIVEDNPLGPAVPIPVFIAGVGGIAANAALYVGRDAVSAQVRDARHAGEHQAAGRWTSDAAVPVAIVAAVVPVVASIPAPVAPAVAVDDTRVPRAPSDSLGLPAACGSGLLPRRASVVPYPALASTRHVARRDRSASGASLCLCGCEGQWGGEQRYCGWSKESAKHGYLLNPVGGPNAAFLPVARGRTGASSSQPALGSQVSQGQRLTNGVRARRPRPLSSRMDKWRCAGGATLKHGIRNTSCL